MSTHEEGASTGGMTGWPLSEYRKRQLEIQFTGSGSEYFRIWITNLLLTVVTLGLYWPFAKARRLQYFYANTLVDRQALSFHGDPWKMFRGHVLLAVLMGAYSIAGQVSPTAGVIAFLVLCVMWPALWRAGLQFRLGNTSWRGLRFGFDAPLKQSYLAFAPIYLPMLIFVAAQATMLSRIQLGAKPDMTLAALVLGASLVSAALSPWSLTLIKRYQHGGYRYAQQDGELALRGGAVYKLVAKSAGMMFGAMLGSLLLVLLFMLVFRDKGGLWASLAPIISTLGTLSVIPFFTARFQNLVWNGTSTQDLEFTSRLGARALFVRSAKNLLLTVVTLGLYRPYAAVHLARLRLEAVSLTLEGDLDTWLARQTSTETTAAGDMAGDFFGIDMGL